MTDSTHFRFSNSVLIVPMAAVIIIWGVYWSEVAFGLNYNHFGVFPRSMDGLKGVFFSPFIHGSLTHLYNNTIALAILLAALFYFYRDIAFRVLIFGVLLSGTITWLIGRESYHIGASGLIYVLASFIFFKGIFSKHYRLIALSLIVVFIYGSLLWYIFPVKDGISWEGHLAGFITGFLFAAFIKGKVPKPKKYDWERDDYSEADDPFLKHFDEDGNFVESPKEERNAEQEDLKINYTYHFKSEDERGSGDSN
jgi:membrane associated rhomboid family serine protease